MATYVNDLRLKEIATGDEAGTWGTSTNTNLELIAEAFSFGTEAITTNADTHTTTIADGSTDPGRSIFLKYTGTLDSACTITIGPNTVSKLWFIENATSGSQNIIIKQGSGATITIPNGQTKAIYSDGAGSGGAMVDAFQDLSIPDLFIDDDLTVGDDLTVTGLATIGETLAVTGVLTANAGVVVDNITIDGTEIDLSSGDLTIDVAGDIILDADGGDVNFKDAGTEYLRITNAVSGPEIFSPSNDADLFFKGVDDSSTITALTLDMSAAGIATFNSGINIGNRGSASDPTLQSSIDPDTGVFWGGSNILGFSSGGAERLRVSSEVVVNDPSNDVDFRVESDGNTNALFVDAGNDRVGVLTSAPDSTLHVSYTSSNANPLLEANAGLNLEGSSSVRMLFGSDQSSPFAGYIQASNTGSGFPIALNPSGGNVGIGTTNPSHDLDVLTATSSTSKSMRVGTTSNSGANNATIIISNGGTGDAMLRFDYEGSNTDRARIGVTSSAQQLEFYTAGNNKRFTIDSSGHFFPNAVNSQDLGLNGNEFRSLYLDTSIISSNPLGIVCGTHLEVDVGGNIKLDADDAGEIRILDGGTQYAQIKKDGNNALFQSIVADGDFLIQGVTGSSFVTAVTFDMSSSGSATFGGNVICSDIKASGSGGLALQTDDGVKRITLEDSGTITLGGNSIAAATTLNTRRSTATGDILRITGGNSNVSEFAAILIHGENVTGGTQKGIITFNTIDVAAVGSATLQERVRVTAEGPTRFVSGTSSVPGISFLDDTNTGFNNPSADNIGFVVGGSQKAFLSASQFNMTGAINGTSKSFRINHPLPAKKDTHHLVHASLEGPQLDLIYRGAVDLVDGSATVNIDTAAGMTEGTFVLLNTNVQCFTSNESGWTAIKGSVSGNILTITAQDSDCTDTISWMVVGERQDQDLSNTEMVDSNSKLIVEPEKVSEGE